MIRRAGTARVSGKVKRSTTRTPVFSQEKTQATSATFVVAKFYRNSEKISSGKLKQKTAIKFGENVKSWSNRLLHLR